jgi:adenylosuccinate synthase
MLTGIIGGQYGSEGKGKVAAYIAPECHMSIRTGGPNAGHTIEHKGRYYKLQTVPCAFINPHCKLAIGAGGFIDLDILYREILELDIKPGQLIIDPQAGIIDGSYLQAGVNRKGRLGSTGKGVGPAVAGKALREDGFHLARDIADLQPFLGDVAYEANLLLDQGKTVCLEGTQGFGLSLNHGYYPYTTNRDTTIGTLCADAGVSPVFLEDTIIVLRTYPIRVAGNSGPMGEEIGWETVTLESGSPEFLIERTTVTNNVRRVARFDMEFVKRAVMINRPTQIALLFVDYIDYQNKGVTAYSKLTEKTRQFIATVESETGVPVTMIGTGPQNADIIDLRITKL